ncbi:hypothetical protein C8Q79DRAFT_767552 [Trametes meyenii]|nr:hypothetical protein C8Q79DRAFT_767552 [Trametes meyenii]
MSQCSLPQPFRFMLNVPRRSRAYVCIGCLASTEGGPSFRHHRASEARSASPLVTWASSERGRAARGYAVDSRRPVRRVPAC